MAFFLRAGAAKNNNDFVTKEQTEESHCVPTTYYAELAVFCNKKIAAPTELKGFHGANFELGGKEIGITPSLRDTATNKRPSFSTFSLSLPLSTFLPFLSSFPRPVNNF